MKEKADAPEKKERHQVGVIRASRAMHQSNDMASMRKNARNTSCHVIVAIS
jgi:hypothetical protein